MGVEGMALSLAKHLLTAWWWNIKVHGENTCPPMLTVLNICQFMTNEETAGGMGEPHWFVAYSHVLQWVGEAAHEWKWEWPMREALEVKASPLMCAFWQETGVDLTVASIKLCWEPPQGPYTIRGKTAPLPTSLPSWMSWQSGSPVQMLGTNWFGCTWWLHHRPLQKQSCMATAMARW